MDRVNTEEYEAMQSLNDDRRKSKSLQEWLFIIALLTNFGGVIWFTASVKTSLDNTIATQQSTLSIINRIVDKQAQTDISIAVIKAQLKLP